MGKCQSGIYMIKNLINNKFYIGSAINFKRRWYNHIRNANLKIHHSKSFENAWHKYGEDNFEFIILEYVEITENLLNREQFYLDKLQPWKRNIGYNLCPNAGSMLGYKHSDETKRKQSENMKGINNPFYNQTHTEETKKILSSIAKIRFTDKKNHPMHGKILSDEIKNKMSLIQKGKRCGEKNHNYGKKNPKTSQFNKETKSKSVVQLDKYSNELIKIFYSMSEVRQILNIGTGEISKCCQNKPKYKTAGGFKWMYCEDYMQLINKAS